MGDMILVYNCGCSEGVEDFELCPKASRLEDRRDKAVVETQSCASNASTLAHYPLTYDDPEYFEGEHSVKDQADKLARVAVDLEDLYYREVRAWGHAQRAYQAVLRHVMRQSEHGEYKYVFLEDPPDSSGDRRTEDR